MYQSDLTSMLAQTVTSGALWVTFFGVLSVLAFAALLITKVGEWILPKPKETRVADFLPFSSLDIDKSTIHFKDGSLARVFELEGKDITLLLPEERESLTDAKKRWIDSMAELEVTSRVITLRQRVPLDEVTKHSNPLLRAISEKWIQNLRRVYRNRHYVILSINDRKTAVRDLDQASQALTAIMDEYHPKLISEDVATKSNDKSPFWLFANLISPLSRPKPRIGTAEGDVLNSLLTADYIHFTGDQGIIKFKAGEKEKLAVVIGIRKTGDFMDEQMTSDLLSIDAELNLLHNVKSIPFVKANAMLLQQRKMSMITSMSTSVYDQYTEALELLDASDSEAQTLNEYAMSIFLFGDTMEEIKFAQEEVERICRLHNVTPVREGWVAQAAYFAQFPTYDVYPRTFLYLSDVISCSISADKTAEGILNSDWGKGPISYFKTITGTAYAFQFHVSSDAYAVAHTALIGPTGQGKTTLFSFLAGQAMRHDDLHTYFFDRNNGAKVFALALNSPYIRFDGDNADVTLNPFAVPNTAANRAFLRTWLRDITGGRDALSEQEIARAVTTAFNYLRPEERILKNLYKSCFSPNSFMRRELFRWVNDDQYGAIFNSETDNLDMSSHYMAFDFTTIFQDPVLAPAVISYVMHRINNMAGLNGDPSLIMIDETAPMLEHPMFKDSFIVGLREGRKKRQAFLCAFQQPNFLESHGLGDVIRGQCQTVIFFRNPQASMEDYKSWGLSPRELNFIAGKEFADKRYAILVSRPTIHESVILDIDLSGLGPFLKVYSSGNKHVLLAEQLKAQIPDQGAFVKAFLDKA